MSHSTARGERGLGLAAVHHRHRLRSGEVREGGAGRPLLAQGLAGQPLGWGLPDFVGGLDEIRQDVEAVQALGADELVLNRAFSPTAHSEGGFMQSLEQLYQLVPTSARAAA